MLTLERFDELVAVIHAYSGRPDEEARNKVSNAHMELKECVKVLLGTYVRYYDLRDRINEVCQYAEVYHTGNISTDTIGQLMNDDEAVAKRWEIAYPDEKNDDIRSL